MAENEGDKTREITPEDFKFAQNPNPPPAAGDSDKTMLLPPRGAAPQPAPAADSDKTLVLPPRGAAPQGGGDDKTLVLPPRGTEGKSGEGTLKLNPGGPAPVVAPKPAPPAKAAAGAKASKVKALGALASALIFLLLGVWGILPGILKKSADKASRANKHAQAAKSLQTALLLRPLHAEIYLVALGRELRLNEDYAGSQKALEEAAAKAPGSYQVWVELAQTADLANQKQAALDAAKKALELKDGDIDVSRLAARLMFELKDYPGAAAAYQKVADSPSGTAEDFKQLGSAQFEAGKFAEAETALKTALAKDGAIKEVNLLLAKDYAAQQNYALAVPLFKTEAAANPTDSAIAEVFADACQKQAGTLIAQKKLNEALSVLQDGLGVPSKAAPAIHYRMATLLAMQKKPKDSLWHLNEAFKGDAGLKAQAAKDPAFASLRKQPAFKKLIK